MEKFEKFKIENQHVIHGGDIINTCVVGDPNCDTDLYDTELDRWIDIC